MYFEVVIDKERQFRNLSLFVKTFSKILSKLL